MKDFLIGWTNNFVLFWCFDQEMYEIGGRKFAFANVMPLGCLPSFRILNPESIGSCVEEVTGLVSLHNKEVAKVLLKLKSQLQGFEYSNADFNTYLTKRMNHPSKYGNQSRL